MDITSVELHPAGSSLVHVLSFRDPRRLNPYNVTSITGLDADAIFPKYYGNSGNSDDRFYNLTLLDRNIVVTVQLNPEFSEGKTYSELRDDLYRTIASSRTGLIELQFKNDATVLAVISGWTTKFEYDHFAQSPTAKLTLKTDDPMLRAPNPVNLNVSGFGVMPIVINDLVSTSPHGFDFVMEFTADSVYQEIKNDADNSWSFKITPAAGFVDGDILHFSSDFKTKQLYIHHQAYAFGPWSDIHLGDAIAPGSVWPLIFPGENKFVLTFPGAVTWTSMSYYPTFWGV